MLPLTRFHAVVDVITRWVHLKHLGPCRTEECHLPASRGGRGGQGAKAERQKRERQQPRTGGKGGKAEGGATRVGIQDPGVTVPEVCLLSLSLSRRRLSVES